jgi:hypothetical protein
LSPPTGCGAWARRSIGGREKDEFLGRAQALLFPIDWPEPFGLVMIEVLACGTPVAAFRNGSVPEIIEDGVTGFVVQSVKEAVEAVLCVDWLDRATSRRAFEQRFDAVRIARDYLEAYRRLIHENSETVPGAIHVPTPGRFTPGLPRPVSPGTPILGAIQFSR